MVDLYHSRRSKYRQCMYWTHKMTTRKEEFVINNEPSGIFYATEVNALQQSPNNVNGVILFEGRNITLQTNDNVRDLTIGNVIQYLNKLWIVDSIQYAFDKKQEEYSDGIEQTYISIRR